MGASLLAITASHPTWMSTDLPLSRASSLPQGSRPDTGSAPGNLSKLRTSPYPTGDPGSADRASLSWLT
nr:hypothetical protein C1892_30470 [Pseudomonas sp. MPBD7-1]